MRKGLVMLLAGTVATPTLARAQRSLEIEPVVGAYSPRGSYVHSGSFYFVRTPDSPRANAGTAYGVNARLWLTRSIGIQLQEMSSTADHPTVFTPGGGAVATTTKVRALTAQALFRPTLPTRARLWLSAGEGTIRHSGSAYTPFGSPSQRTIALGAGATIPLWRGLSAAAGVDDLIYDWTLTDQVGPYQSGSQSDVVARVGLSLTIR
jgi:hypothetical protein